MRKNSSDFKTGFVSEAGTFRTNKDYFAFMELDDVACWVIADGIDSDEEMESAELAANVIFEDFADKPSMSRRKIKRYIKKAHNTLKSESKSVRLKASLLILVTDYSKIIWGTVGNARMYHFRKGGFNFKSKDHSIAQMMADAGKISQDDINEHEERNNLTYYLGKTNKFSSYVSRSYKLSDGDVMLLCTSGFWESVSNMEMLEAVKQSTEPDELVDYLEELLLSKQNKVVNNYTVAAVYCNKVFKETTKNSLNIAKKVAAVLVPVLIVGAGMFVYKKIDASKAKELLVKYERNGDNFIKDGSYEEALKEYSEAQECLKKVKDEKKEVEIQRKYRITQLVIDGDNYFKEKNYEKAQDNYLKARSEADEDKNYDKTELEEKILKAQSCIDIIDLEKEGDDLAIKGNFNKAIEKYKEAKGLAEKIYNYDMVKELKLKIDDINSKKKEKAEAEKANAEKKQDIEKGKKQSEELEKQGDKKFASNDDNGAIKYYKMAQEEYRKLQDKYNETNAMEEILRIEGKIEKAEKRIEEIKAKEEKAKENKE